MQAPRTLPILNKKKTGRRVGLLTICSFVISSLLCVSKVWPLQRSTRTKFESEDLQTYFSQNMCHLKGQDMIPLTKGTVKTSKGL